MAWAGRKRRERKRECHGEGRERVPRRVKERGKKVRGDKTRVRAYIIPFSFFFENEPLPYKNKKFVK